MPSIAFVNLTLAMIIVGSSVVAGKIMVDELPVNVASMLRFAMALGLLVPVVYFREGGFPRLSRRSWLFTALQSLCGSYLFTVFLLHGLTMTGPAAAGIITATTPACMGILSWLMLRERPKARVLAGIALSVTGVMAVNLTTSASSDNSLYGNLLVLVAVVFESLFLLLRKTVREPVSPLTYATLISLFGFLFFLPSGTYELVTQSVVFTTTGWLSLVYYGLVVTALSYMLWFAGVVHVPGSIAGVFTAIMPVSALVLAALVLGETLTTAHMIGCGSVLGGIVLISLPDRRTRGNSGQPIHGKQKG